MANTTNFGWETPDDTDLVKDGAAAMRTLGSAIDTSMGDLKGGTTGQVLAKNSNTDMDFIWTADASGIPTTIVDAKGDLIAATAADTVSRLAVGTNGQVLTADSTVSTGVKWATPAAGGTYTQLATGSFTGSSLTISGLSGNELYIVCSGWNGNSTASSAYVRFNSDTGTNYYSEGSPNTARDNLQAATTPYQNSVSNVVFQVFGTTSGTQIKRLASAPFGSNGGYWVSTSAVTSITIYLTGGSFSAGTYYVWSR